MIWFLYNILFGICYVLMVPKYLLRMKKRGGYKKGFLQRFGVYESDVLTKIQSRQRIWVHAVSVGEVFVALKYIEQLREKKQDAAFILTTNTSTGYGIATDWIHKDDVVLYFPCDFPLIIRKVLKLLKPVALIITECELWPNLIRAAHKRNIPVIMINGRISQSSYSGYKKIRVFISRVLSCFDLLLVQSKQDSQRLLDLGAGSEKLHVVGTAKYDLGSPDATGENEAMQALKQCGFRDDAVILLGGSTWPGEERILIEIYKEEKRNNDKLKLVIVPRHMERREEVEAEIQAAGFTYSCKSQMKSEDVDVLLVDTTGELKSFYACASIVYVGKSLLNHGGQNIIEPAFFAKPIVVGPNVENFPVVMSDFLEASAVIQIADEAELKSQLSKLISDSRLCSEYGSRARSLVDKKIGIVSDSADRIIKVI